jgi:hypothetical protein
MLSSSKDDMIGWLRPPASLKPVACSAYGWLTYMPLSLPVFVLQRLRSQLPASGPSTTTKIQTTIAATNMPVSALPVSTR